MSFYEQLLQETRQEQQQLQSLPIIQRALTGRVSLQQYVAFLTQAYHHVKHTLPLLMSCGARLPQTHEWLRADMAHYVEEEVGHQEWILNDIAACGFDAEAVRNGQPSAATELMVAYAYDTTMRGNPAGFLGMVHVLEGTSVQLATHAASALQKALDLPGKAFTYLKSHGSLDLQHVDFFAGVVNRLDLEQDRQAVIHGARMFFQLYGNIFRSLDAEVAA
jgi:pyrroloquinoline quinone (PQQ) biosynthesis protein C